MNLNWISAWIPVNALNQTNGREINILQCVLRKFTFPVIPFIHLWLCPKYFQSLLKISMLLSQLCLSFSKRFHFLSILELVLHSVIREYHLITCWKLQNVITNVHILFILNDCKQCVFAYVSRIHNCYSLKKWTKNKNTLCHIWTRFAFDLSVWIYPCCL